MLPGGGRLGVQLRPDAKHSVVRRHVVAPHGHRPHESAWPHRNPILHVRPPRGWCHEPVVQLQLRSVVGCDYRDSRLGVGGSWQLVALKGRRREGGRYGPSADVDPVLDRPSRGRWLQHTSSKLLLGEGENLVNVA